MGDLERQCFMGLHGPFSKLGPLFGGVPNIVGHPYKQVP